ncbi:MAG: pilus assembly protein PilM [Candidatus Omnitrophica bacterium]|nr:pilus assembly protein PilM [Candidatus Omnitrophota bacterium]
MGFPVGLEIGDRYLKMAASKPSKESPGSFQLAAKPIQGLKDEDVSKAIKELIEKSAVKTGTVVISLPRNLVTMRNLHLPSHDPEEISQMIDLHISRIVPYKKEEISFDHLSLRTDSLGYTAEVLAIVHKDVLKRYQGIVENAGLDIDGIFLSTYGVWQWTVDKFKSEINDQDLYLLLDIDSTYTDFIIFNKDNILFSRTLAFELKDVIPNSETNKLMGEIKQSLLIFHKNESINKKPLAIFVSGSYDDNIMDAIRREFTIPVNMVPAPATQASRIKDTVLPKEASMTAVTEFISDDKGEKLSFALPEMLIRRSLKEKTRELTILGTTLIYLFAAIMAFFWGRQYNQQFYLKRLVNRNTLIERDVGSLLGQYKRMSFVKDFLYRRSVPMLLIDELGKMTPPEIVLNYIAIENNEAVTIRGQGLKLSDVFKFVTTLENSKYFKDVSTKSTRTKKVKERDVTDFEINFAISLGKNDKNK